MSIPLQVAMALGSVLVLLGLMALVRHLAAAGGINAEVQRKLVHIGTGLYALTLPWLFPDRWPVYMLVVLTLGVMMVLRMPRVASAGLGATLHGVNRQSYGDVLLAISVGLCLFLAQDRLFLYVLPIAVLTLADAAAALAGTTYGTRFFRVEDGEKSIEGSVVFFIVTLLISVLCLMVMTPFAPLNIIVVSLMVAGFGTLVEAVSWRGFDNLFLPLGLLIFLAVHADGELVSLVLLASFFGLSIVAFKLVAPRLGLTNHAARVYVTTAFLLVAVTALQNAVTPILVLFAHAWARSAAPCTARFPDLDIVAALALVSFGWLVLGNATEWNAISFYGMTAMGMTMGLCALALSPRGVPIRIVGLLDVGAVLCVIRAVAFGLNPDHSQWNGPMWVGVIVTLVLTAALPALLAGAFRHARVSKIALLALVVPVAIYIASLPFFKGLS